MLDIITKAYKMAGRYRNKLRWGAGFIFLQHISVLMQFIAIYLGFSWLKELDEKKIEILFLIVLFSLILNFIGMYGQCRTISGTFFTVFHDYRETVGERLKKAPMGFFNKVNLSKILDALTMIVKSVEMMLSLAFQFIFSGIAICLFLLIGLFSMHIYIGLFALIIVLLAWLTLFLMYSFSKKEVYSLHDKNIAYSETLIDGIRGIPVLRSFPNIDSNIEEEIHQKVNQASQDIVENQKRLEIKSIVCFRIFDTLLYLGSLGITFITYYLFMQNQVETPEALTLCGAGFMLFGGMKQLENITILGAKTPHEMDYLKEIADLPQMEDGPLKLRDNDIDIEFINLSFAYDKRPILKDISMKIPSNKKIAIVGPSGSGKTTLMNLIARFYDPQKGAIKLGGKDLRDFEVKTLLSYFSLVFQDVYLFNDTIANNIRIAKSNASMDEIIEAAKKARCHEFIMEFPEGYDTNVGEEGSRLSGGERQRISIARALLKDAPIILLDEATSNIDPENEGEILNAIDELTKNKTVVTIAHRLSTVENADNIIVLDHGRIVQEGNHQKLIEEDGIYKRFIEARERAQYWDISI